MKTLKFEVTIPGIPESDQYSDEYVTSWLRQEIGHPYDAAYEADVRVKLLPTTENANPERENNGCMTYRGPASQGA